MPDQQRTQPDGSVVDYDASGRAMCQTWPDGRVTTFEYRGDQYVATTGDQHVLYDANGSVIKQWQGSDESSAALYHRLDGGHYSLTSPDGTVTEYLSDGHLVQQTTGGQITTFEYRGDNYVATTGDQHVLYDANGTEIKQWQGGDESSASFYHKLGNGDYTLTDPNGAVTEFTDGGHLVRQTGADGKVTTFEYRGDNYVATTGDQHVLYDANGNEVKQWQGDDESSAALFHKLGNGNYTLTDARGTTEYSADGHLVRQVGDNGQVTTFQYCDDQYVATTGDQHVLYDANGNEVKQWQGDDESSASFYHKLGNGDYTLTNPDGAVTEFADDGHLVKQTGADGKVTTFEYRGDNYVATTGDQHVLYDADGNEVKQWQGDDESSAALFHKLGNGNYTLTDSNGTIEYAADGHLVQQTSGGQVTTFEHRGDNYVATTGDQHVLYDANGNEVKQWQGDDESSASFYHKLGNGDYTLTDPNGAVTEFTDDGHLVKQTGADSKVTTFEYRGDNYVATTGDQHVLYDADGNEVKQWQGGDESSASLYHKLGNGDYTLTDPDGAVTEFTDDGHLVRQTGADGKVTTFEYRGDQYVATTGDTHVLYDADGNEVKQWQGGDESTAQTYAKLDNGNYTLTDPDGAVTEFADGGHLVKQTGADGKVTTFEYRGDQYVATTGNAHVLYDANGNEVKQWQGDDESSASLYHKLGNGDYTLTDSKDTVTEYTDDGHLVKQTGADGKVTTFEYRGDQYVATTGNAHVLYDANGNEIKQWEGDDESSASFYHTLGNGNYTLTDPKGTVTEYADGGHLVKQTGADGKVTTFEYRGDIYVATTGNMHVLYDANGNEVKQWEGADESSASFYHTLGNGNYTLTDPKGTVTEYADGGHLVKQTGADGKVTTFQYRGDQYVATTGNMHVLYDANGNEIKQWEGNDESTASFYHKLPNGHFTLTDPAGTVTEYNEQNQPILVQKPGQVPETIQWQPDGTYIVTQGIEHSKYNSNGQLLKTWTGSDESVASHYKYLSNGGLIVTGPDGSTEYGANGMSITTTTPDGKVINWKVDLQALNDAITSVRRARDVVEGDLQRVKGVFTDIQGVWRSPAANSFTMLSGDFTKASTDLMATLDEGLRRMHASYQNYVTSEEKNSSIIMQIGNEARKLAGQAGGAS
ncbi:hypothetical protein AB0M36_16860 [Actinoplanes sp. NPDC051346]|uniref:hypothetical protein n=1 Tax=Actinoplanes sp. NPDC051346 TaxID=3155048 RepID=UPI003436913B